MPAVLPSLPYAHDALEPVIDTLTMQIHHANASPGLRQQLQCRHRRQGGPSRAPRRPAPRPPRRARGHPAAVRNNGGGHVNHSLFWTLLAPAGKGGGGEPSGALADAVKAAFGSPADFKTKFQEAGTSVSVPAGPGSSSRMANWP